MAPKAETEKVVTLGLFEGCSINNIKVLTNGALEHIQEIVNDVGDEAGKDQGPYEYFLPRKIWAELDRSQASVKDLTSGKNEMQRVQTREKSISMAIADTTQHMLKFLYPGQVLMLTMLDEIRIENKSLKVRLKTIEDWVEKNDIIEMAHELKGVKAELSELIKISTGRDRVDPGKETKQNQRQTTNAKTPTTYLPTGIEGKILPGIQPEVVRKKNKKRKNQGKNEDSKADPSGNEDQETSEGAEIDDTPFKESRKKRNNRGPKKPEVISRNQSKQEQLASKEIIIHGLTTPKDEKEKIEESVRIMDVLNELDPEWLGFKKGVIIDMTNDIAFHERIIGHYDGDENGCEPVKIRFKTKKVCDRVKGAAGAAGALNGRKPIHTNSKYRVPKTRDPNGKRIDEDPEVIERAKNRPKIFFRGSITKEQKLQFAKIKQERADFRNGPKFQDISEKREKTLATRVVFGNLRNVDEGKIDEISGENRQRLMEHKRVKEKEREDLRAAKIAKSKAEDTSAGTDGVDTVNEAKSRFLTQSVVPTVVEDNKSK